MNTRFLIGLFLILSCTPFLPAQQDSSLLTIDRIFASSEFRQDYLPPFQWIDGGEAYARIEYSEAGEQELVKYTLANSKKTVLLKSEDLIPGGNQDPVLIEDFQFSTDQSRVLIFTNSSRVWRANTKGDFWMYNFKDRMFRQIGTQFPASSLQFAKFSEDNTRVGYVQGFNVYVEDLKSGKVTQLTKDGGDGIINGTFDWAYEEEFGVRDGFSWNAGGDHIAFWNLDASGIGTFYMINNTDSTYSKPIPIQYPKVGEDPSSCRVGVVSVASQKIKWIPLEGSTVQNYIPGMQWLDGETLLIQRLNRHQNELTIWTYNIKTDELKKIYTESEETWVDIQYPDITSSSWGDNDLKLVDNNRSFLRLVDSGGWRHLYKVNIKTGEKILLTPGDYDVASVAANTSTHVYFHASPDNSTQRYLFRVDLKGSGTLERITPKTSIGMNIYQCSPNGKYAIHSHTAALAPRTINVVSLPEHRILDQLVDNQQLSDKLSTLNLPEVEFFQVTTEEGIEIDGRMTKPINFDPNRKYPVLFNVYGEPWGQVATDNWVGMWDIFLAQQGYLVIAMDNRGTPCLKGSEWRKSIYRKVGVINSRDQALAAKEVLKMPFVDPARTAVWGWSGGGSMTLNLLFRYPEIYTTGMAVAPVGNQLMYDNIYQERYMGLPQENREDFIEGSPVTYAKNLQGNLLIVHGTADDNVHYQNTELIVNELIKHNKQFQMMSYPNRSHGVYEGPNTTRHLYTLLTNYLTSKVPSGIYRP